MKLYIMIEEDLVYMLKVEMYENSQKQGSYRREKSGESCLKNQSCQKDNIARRRQPYVNTVYRKNFAPVLFSPFFSEGEFKTG